MFSVHLHPIGVTLKVNAGTPLMDVLHEYGVEFPCGGAGTCGGCKVRLLEGNIQITDKHAAALRKKGLTDSWRLACMSVVEDNLTLEVEQWHQLILADNTKFEFAPQQGYGIAVDLGSTTIVSQLVNLHDGSIVGMAQDANPQAKFGSDIMSRIAFVLKEKGNASLLTQLAHEAVYAQIQQLFNNNQSIDLEKVVIVGNTVMHHIFAGLNLEPLATFPFLSPRNEAINFSPKELGWNLPDEVKICFEPNLGSFVGSDILAGVLASRMHQKQTYSVLIDLGTNGEIAVGNREKILCTSTSAGPAFEGAVISCGMRAGTGAISSVEKNAQGELQTHVIGNVAPRGICGSGLIDAIATFAASGDIESSGSISGEREKLFLQDKITLSQGDIRELQLAKSAIATGVKLLMKRLNISMNEVDNVYIAGAFGSYINTRNATSIGLLEFADNKIVKLGNSALIGAKMLLFDQENSVEKITKITSHISLEADPNFQDIFCEKLEFPS